MPLQDNQDFLSLYYDRGTVEIAVGDVQEMGQHSAWKGDTKSLGQVATPQPVAAMMANWVMSARPASVLDPAAGLGALLHECRTFDSKAQLVGVERDRKTLQRAIKSAPPGTKLVLADYLLSDSGKFQGIIANPPYVKAHRLDYSEDAWQGFEERFGTHLDRLTNVYALFLLKIWEDLAPRGRAAVLLPAEFLNANFGLEIKQRIQKVIRPAGLVIFVPEINLFPQSLTTSAVVLLEKGRDAAAPCPAIKANSVAVAAAFVTELVSSQPVPSGVSYRDVKELDPKVKWLNLFFNGHRATADSPLLRTVGDFFDCRRGIATGANEYFCLSVSEAHKHELDLTDFDPCLTRARDAEGLVFSRAQFNELAASDRKCYLLNPRREGPALRKYLGIGESEGIPRRHLPSHRPVWYLPENRAVADIWVAVFSREKVKFILNRSGAKNLTCFHGLYAKRGSESLTPLMTLYLNSSWGARAFSQVNRFYGDGLNKLEPKDVEALPCPDFPNLSQEESEQIVLRMEKLRETSGEERTKEVEMLVRNHLQLATT